MLNGPQEKNRHAVVVSRCVVKFRPMRLLNHILLIFRIYCRSSTIFSKMKVHFW